MKLTQLLFATLLSSTLFVGCKKEAVQKTEPEANAKITYKLRFDNKSANGGRLQKSSANRMMAGQLALTGGYVTVSDISFDGIYNGGHLIFSFTQTQRVDLATAAGVLGTIALPAGTYEKATFGVGFTPSGSNAALEMRGAYTDGGMTLPIVFRVDQAFRLKVSKQSPTVITESPDFIALATLAVANLANGVTEEALMTAQITNGVLVISSTSNTNLYNLIYNNLQKIINVELN